MAEGEEPSVHDIEDVVDAAKEQWVTKVMSTIPLRWRDFLADETFKVGDDTILILLQKTLCKVYEKHFNANGWRISPSAGQIMGWMTCPPNNVRAIILLMEPKHLKYGYASTGQALGVRRCSGYENLTIENLPNLRNLFKVLMALMDKEEWTLSKYNSGFDPSYFSKKGILFLNYLLTRGEKHRQDIEWTEFFEALLRAIGKSDEVEQIAIVQFYNNYEIQEFFESESIAAKFSVYRPSFMDKNHFWRRNKEYNQHLPRFTEANINAFVNGLREQKEFGDIIREIAEEVLYGENCVVHQKRDPN